MPRHIVSFVKKHRSGLLAVLLIALLAVILTGASVRADRHVIHARYDAQAHTLHVTQGIHLTNRTGQVLEHLCLMHLRLRWLNYHRLFDNNRKSLPQPLLQVLNNH